MRTAFLLCASVGLLAQDVSLRSTARLVVAPLSVLDKRGEPVESLETRDLIVYDNNVAINARVDSALEPLSLVVVVQASDRAQSALDKLRKEASLLGPLLIGDRGEAGVIAFADEVRVLQEFTRDPAKVENAIRNLDAFGNGGVLVDAVAVALRMLERQPKERRRAILLISEKHDRGSNEQLEAVVRAAERVNAVLYALSFSPTKTMFANRAPKYCDPERKCRRCNCGNCAYHCDREPRENVPSNTQTGGGMNLFILFGELKRQAQGNIPQALAKLSGGDSWDFARREGLEAALQRIGEDLHHHYVVTFPMAKSQPGSFHKIRVEVRGRPELIARTRSGYYELADE